MMKRETSISSTLKIVLIIAAVCIALFPLILFVISFFVIGYEPVSYKEEINNPIINADYSNWHEVVLSNEETIMLPAEWTVTVTGSMTVITDEYGQAVAKGGRLLRGEESYYQYDQLLSELLGFTVSNITLTASGTVRSSEYGRLIIADESQTEFIYILLSKAGAYDMLFIFDPIVKNEHSNLIDISEAVVFSYVWK